jgi:hypothetical protein
LELYAADITLLARVEFADARISINDYSITASFVPHFLRTSSLSRWAEVTGKVICCVTLSYVYRNFLL